MITWLFQSIMQYAALVTSGLEENTLELVEKFSCHRLVIQSQNYQNIVYTIDSWGAIIILLIDDKPGPLLILCLVVKRERYNKHFPFTYTILITLYAGFQHTAET